jgi:hypothetical protein
VQYTFCHLKTKDSDNQQIGLARRLSRDQLQAKNHTHPREAGEMIAVDRARQPRLLFRRILSASQPAGV